MPVYKFPKDPIEQKRWKEQIPRSNLVITKYSAVCRLHWPESAVFIPCYGKLKPVDPPSLFPHIPKSCLTSPPPKIRKTLASSSSRGILPDEINNFLQQDKLLFNEIDNVLSITQDIFVFKDIDCYLIQSKQLNNGIPCFILKIFENLSFEAFHTGVSCTISTLSSNRITVLNTKSGLFEAIRFLKAKENDHKKNILLSHVNVMGKQNVGSTLYPIEVILRAFEYFAKSRSLYNSLCEDYKLPSIRTLTRLTSIVNKLDDIMFLEKVLSSLCDVRQRQCVIMIDENYVKPALLYQRGTLFGKAVNNPTMLATTVLSFMIKSLFGGPEFLSRILPVTKLTAGFQFDQCTAIIETIKQVNNGKVLAILTDGNRVNQSFFKKFETYQDKPWLTKDNIFYLLQDGMT